MNTPPFAVLCVDHVVLRVRDLAASEAFYREALGCVVVRRRDDLGLVHVRAGTSLIDLVSVTGELGRQGGAAPGPEGRNVDHVCLRVEPFDADAIDAHLATIGVQTCGRAATNFGAAGVGPALYLRDPDGNTIELKGTVADAGPGT